MSRAYTSPGGLEQLRKNRASGKDFKHTQATEAATARDRGGSPHQQFSSLVTFLARSFPGFKGVPWFHLQLFQLIKGSEKDRVSTGMWDIRPRQESRWKGGSRTGPLAATSHWDIQVPVTASPQPCLVAPCWPQGVSSRRAPCYLQFSKYPPHPTSKIGYDVINIKLA